MLPALARLISLCLATFLLGGGLLAIPADAAPSDPTGDYFKLPTKCLPNGTPIPIRPGACYIGAYKSKRPTVVVWGDSHALQHLAGIQEATRGRNVNLVAFVFPSCPPTDPGLPMAQLNDSCERANAFALKWVLKHHRREGVRVIFGTFWQSYLSRLRGVNVVGDQIGSEHDLYIKKRALMFKTGTPRLFRTLREQRVPVDAIAQSPYVPTPAQCAEGQNPFVCDLPRGQALPQSGLTRRYIEARLRGQIDRPRYIQYTQAICTKQVCHGLVDGVYTWHDQLHLSATRSRLLAPYFSRSIDLLLAAN